MLSSNVFVRICLCAARTVRKEQSNTVVDGVMLTVTGFFNTFGLEVLPTFKQDSTLEA